MVFKYFEDIFPLVICLDNFNYRLFLKYYSEQIIILMKNLENSFDNEDFKEEIRQRMDLYSENHNWYKGYFFPEVNIILSVIIETRFNSLPCRNLDVIKIESLDQFRPIKNYINDRTNNFIRTYNVKTLIECIIYNQYDNLSYSFDENDDRIRESIAQSILSSQLESITERHKELFRNLNPLNLTFEELNFVIREICMLNVMISTSEMQRHFRFILFQTLKTQSCGETEPSMNNIIYFLKLINWIMNFDIIEFHLKKKIPIYLIENEALALLYIPKKLRLKLKDQKIGEIQKNRLLLIGTNYLIYEEDNPYQDLLTDEWSQKYEIFQALHNKFMDFPLNDVYYLKSEDLDRFESIIDDDYSPISYYLNSDGNRRYFTSKVQLMDRDFRFFWDARHEEHIKVYGTAFENYVSAKLEEDSPYLLVPNRYFKGLQYDQILYSKPYLFVIDSKDLKLIDRIDERQKISSRKHELKKYCEYLKEKSILIKDNFNEFVCLFPEFAECNFLILLIISHNPEYYLEFDDVCVITLMEFLQIHQEVIGLAERGYNPVTIRGNLVESDISDWFFNFHIINIEDQDDENQEE